jgi:tRNA(fMet)-specific endonuclease VapC
VLINLRRHRGESALASPVWHELWFGCERLGRSKRRRQIEAYLKDVIAATLPILPYDREAAAWHAAERARLSKNGRPPPFVDGQIAAIATVNGLSLVSSNRKDFERFRDLEVVSWWSPA